METRCAWCASKEEDEVDTSNLTDDNVMVLLYYLQLALGAYAKNPLQIQVYTGISQEDILVFKHKSRRFRPAYFLAYDRRTKSMIISIRGTYSLSDVMTNASFRGNVRGKYGHRGFYNSAKNIFRKVQLPLVTYMTGHNVQSIRIVGHSLGGAVATLLCTMLWDAFPSVRCFTFAPPPSCTRKFFPKCRSHVISVINNMDPVPSFSMRNGFKYALTKMLPVSKGKKVRSLLPKYQKHATVAHSTQVLRRTEFTLSKTAFDSHDIEHISRINANGSTVHTSRSCSQLIALEAACYPSTCSQQELPFAQTKYGMGMGKALQQEGLQESINYGAMDESMVSESSSHDPGDYEMEEEEEEDDLLFGIVREDISMASDGGHAMASASQGVGAMYMSEMDMEAEVVAEIRDGGLLYNPFDDDEYIKSKVVEMTGILVQSWLQQMEGDISSFEEFWFDAPDTMCDYHRAGGMSLLQKTRRALLGGVVYRMKTLDDGFVSLYYSHDIPVYRLQRLSTSNAVSASMNLKYHRVSAYMKSLHRFRANYSNDTARTAVHKLLVRAKLAMQAAEEGE